MYWTPANVASTAPDPATLERAKGIVQPFRWQELYGNEQLLWAFYTTGGDQPFRVAVHLLQPAFSCSCPARSRPCKHILALLLLYLQKPEAFAASYDLPDWVAKWNQRFQKKSTLPSEIAPAQPNPMPASATFDTMSAGVMELDTWLRDLMQHGLAISLSREATFWDTFAARMVNAKLPAIGRRIRHIKTLTTSENPLESLTAIVSDLFLFVQGFKRYEALPADFQHELLAIAGATIRKENIIHHTPPVSDIWCVIGQTESEEEGLRLQRTWLQGVHSSKTALLLDFAWGNAPYDSQWTLGMCMRAEVVFYPGLYPLRALVSQWTLDTYWPDAISAFANWHAFAQAFSAARSANPWLSTFPGLIDRITPVVPQQTLLLLDEQQLYIPAALNELGIWKLMALSGGHPVSVFGEWNGERFVIYSVLLEGRVTPL